MVKNSPYIQEYILINAKKPRFECFHRHENGLWVLQSHKGTETLFQFTGNVNFQPLASSFPIHNHKFWTLDLR